MDRDMSSLGDILKGVSLGMNPPGPSPTSNEIRLCQCGQPVSGVRRSCPACWAKSEAEHKESQRKLRQESIAKAKLLLPNVVSDIQDEWLAELPSRFADKTFANFEQKRQLEAFQVMDSLDLDGNASAVLLSPHLYGLGKTHLLCAFAHKVIRGMKVAYVDDYGEIHRFRQSSPVLYSTEGKLLARIRATFNRRQDDEAKSESEEDVYRQFESVTYLLVDEVAKVRPHDLSFLQSVYFRIIDTRYSDERPIVLASNLSPSEFEAHVGGACADRLREMCGKNIIVMKGQSYRLRGVKAE